MWAIMLLGETARTCFCLMTHCLLWIATPGKHYQVVLKFIYEIFKMINDDVTVAIMCLRT